MDDIFDLEKLKKDQEDAENKKLLLQSVGAVGQALTSAPTAFELLKGKQMSRPDIQGTMNNYAKSVEDPTERQMKLYQMSKAAKEAEEQKKKEADEKVLKDVNSNATKAAYVMAEKYGIPYEKGVTTAYELHKQFDPKKMLETEAMSKVNFDNDMRKLAATQNFQREQDWRKFEQEKALADIKKKTRELPASSAESISKSRAALTQIDDLEKSLGSIEGFNAAGILNPKRYIPGTDDSNTKNVFNNQAKQVMQNVGTFMEGGKLTDEDFQSKYLPMAPSVNDSETVRKAKIEAIRRMVAERAKTDIDSYGRSGYDVSGFNLNLPETKNPLQNGLPKNPPVFGDMVPSANAGGANQGQIKVINGQKYIRDAKGWKPL